jgi:Xaa-Pro aminopeptidase
MIGMSGENDTASTLVGSSLDRKIYDAQVPDKPKPNTRPRLAELRKLMVKEEIDY